MFAYGVLVFMRSWVGMYGCVILMVLLCVVMVVCVVVLLLQLFYECVLTFS